MPPMVIDQVKKAEILYEHGSMKNFVKQFFMGTSVDFTYLEILYLGAIKDVEPHEIESNWEDSEEEYCRDGYSRNDIRYSDEAEALLAAKEEAYEEIACSLTKEYFHDNQEMIPYLVEYIESELA